MMEGEGRGRELGEKGREASGEGGENEGGN